MYKLIKSLVVISILTAPMFAAAGDAVNYDDFSKPIKWYAYSTGGPTAIQNNGRLEITIPSNASGSVFHAGYTSACKLHGDFDVQADYVLLNFPLANGVRVGLSADGIGAVERVSWSANEHVPYSETYVTDINSDCCHQIATSNQDGTLRMTRNGNAITGYYYDKAVKRWIKINTTTSILDDVPFRVSAWSHDYAFSDNYVKVAFDNVVVNKGALVGVNCPKR